MFQEVMPEVPGRARGRVRVELMPDLPGFEGEGI